MKIAHVSTFPQMRCGIALYAADLITALPYVEHVKYALHYGINFSNDSALDADVSKVDDLRLIASAISKSDCDVVSLQHEFWIWGGAFGENIISFLDELSKPLVSTLHTTFNPTKRHCLQTAILRRVVEQSSRVVVLTEESKQMVCHLADDSGEKVAVIPHGVPDTPFVSAPTIWSVDSKAGLRRSLLSLVSLGFFRRGKGLEEILLALWMLKRRGLSFSYLMAGGLQGQFAGEKEYLREVRGLIKALDLQKNVMISDAFLSVSDQIQEVQNRHAGIFAYQDASYSSSGTIPLVLSAGRPVICTPFEYALTTRDELGGFTIAMGFGAAAIAKAVLAFSRERNTYRRVTRSLYERTRAWKWGAVGSRYFGEYRIAARRN